LDLKLLEVQTSDYFSSAEEIVGKTRENVYNNKQDLEKIGDNVEVKEVVTIQNESYFYVIVDGYTYKVSMEGTNYLGEQTNNEIELKEGEITFSYNPNDLTNGSVKVKITTTANLNEYTIEYRKQGDSVWTTYAGEFE
jgi:hypothetical protein